MFYKSGSWLKEHWSHPLHYSLTATLRSCSLNWNPFYWNLLPHPQALLGLTIYYGSAMLFQMLGDLFRSSDTNTHKKFCKTFTFLLYSQLRKRLWRKFDFSILVIKRLFLLQVYYRRFFDNFVRFSVLFLLFVQN